MKPIQYRVTAGLLLGLLAHGPVAGAAQSRDLPEPRFERQYRTPEAELELRGVGLLRYMGFLKVYAGAFYLEPGVPVDQALAKGAKRLEVEYLRSFKAEDFGSATLKLMQRNVDAGTLEKIRDRIQRHNALYEDVEPGDRYALTYIPGKGTELSLNGMPKGVIEGEEFASALFSIWLGSKPMDASFKRQITGAP